MKTKITFTLALLLTAGQITSCSVKKEDHHDHAATENIEAVSDSVSGPQFLVDINFQKQLADVFASYVTLKDAFVSSDPVKVKSLAGNVAQSLQKTDMKLLSGAAHNDWMNYQNTMQSSLQEIQSGADLAAQRKSFSTLSDNLYKSIKAFGLGGTEAFYEFCPMAFNNEGAYWLSDQSQIRNPYFGDEMLTCGSVVENLK
ncbi:MAG TPA: DUF3347 domain-containing protein [Ohtaekwangia sp.]